MTRKLMSIVVLAFAFAMAGQCASHGQDAKPFLHPLFTDNMVLQRDVMAPVWGWTEPGQKVTVRIDDVARAQRAVTSATAVSDADGKWMVKLGPFGAGGPYPLTVSGPQEVTVNNVMVGDVWICSGQSNMQFGVGGVNNAQEEIANANLPNIRLFTVPNVTAGEPQSTVNGQWQVCSPQTIAGFSAVGYFFGRKLHQELKLPIGLINSSWGGTIAEAWTSGEALKTMPDFQPAVAQLEQTVAEQKKGAVDFDKKMAEWWAANDPGSAQGLGWADPQLPPAEWKTMNLPQNWEAAGLADFDGVVWFRREFEVPAAWASKELMLHLGPIDDQDTTWVNGTQVGGLINWNAPRDYKIPAGVVKPGRNVIAVRVLDTAGGGGIYGKPDEMKLEVAGEAATAPLSLAGAWSYRESTPLAKMQPGPVRFSNNPNIPTVLYNGMIAPLVPFAIKGAIWYQGESNAGRGMQYRTLLPTMIKDWRSRFGVGDFPFYIVQLANFMPTKPEPSESGWAELREAQLLTAQNVPHTGLAVITDIGDTADIHPKNKQDVGLRLALAALGTTYGQKIAYSGPIYRSMTVEGNAVRLSFDHLGGGLVAKGGDKLQGFAIAGEDGKFVWADAKIDGDTVVVSSPQVEKPVAVRYAWADNPVANLYNKAGLPASPFRTDLKP